jgi:hypothetical protein
MAIGVSRNIDLLCTLLIIKNYRNFMVLLTTLEFKNVF